MCTQTTRAGHEVERRWHVTWTLESTIPGMRWEPNTLSWITVKHFSTNKRSSNRFVPQVRSPQSSLGLSHIQTALLWRRRKLHGCSIHVHLNRGWHRLNMNTTHDSNGTVQVCPGLESSFIITEFYGQKKLNAFHSLASEIFKFASHTGQGNSASCPPTPSTTVSTATIQHIYEDYKGGLT